MLNCGFCGICTQNVVRIFRRVADRMAPESRYDQDMARDSGKVHVVRVSKTGYVDKQGRRRDYSSAYLRRTYRDGGKVRNETVANLSALPDHVIDLIDAGLKGQRLVPASDAVTITGSLPHGHAAAVHAMAAKL